MQYEYFINLDERGMFNADVRDPSGNTVLEFSNEHELDRTGDIDENPTVEYGEISLVEDGYMKHGRDIDGLRDYMIEVGIIRESDSLISINQ